MRECVAVECLERAAFAVDEFAEPVPQPGRGFGGRVVRQAPPGCQARPLLRQPGNVKRARRQRVAEHTHCRGNLRKVRRTRREICMPTGHVFEPEQQPPVDLDLPQQPRRHGQRKVRVHLRFVPVHPGSWGVEPDAFAEQDVSATGVQGGGHVRVPPGVREHRPCHRAALVLDRGTHGGREFAPVTSGQWVLTSSAAGRRSSRCDADCTESRSRSTIARGLQLAVNDEPGPTHRRDLAAPYLDGVVIGHRVGDVFGHSGQPRAGRGRRHRVRRVAAVEAEIAALCRPRWVGEVLTISLTGHTPAEFRLAWRTDQKARKRLENRFFGKRILFPNRTEWTVAEVVAVYRS
ncbi:hypothetical protein [Saccharopolyspora spinosa]|uniref:hypothetical protein n=1 Tax=Saccharopolyspora spinosa TaxID=60894 RepID=UPI00049856CF|nr:hypothetical protein [Saccharopolyspora spinosa]